MKTSSFVYKDSMDFIKHINTINIESDDKILVQVFCSIFDKVFINKLIIEIKEGLPSAKIIGTSAKIGIFEAQYIKDSCIVIISSFETTHIQTYGIEKTSNDSYEIGKQLFW